MAFTVKHVRKRNGVFYYERRVPEDIMRDATTFQSVFRGQKLFRRSLRTKDQARVFLAAETARATFEELVACARGEPVRPLEPVAPARRKLTPEVLEDITASYHRSVLKPWVEAYVRAERGGHWSEELDRMKEQRESDAADWRAVLLNPGAESRYAHIESPGQMAHWEIERRGWDVEPDSDQFGLLVTAIRKGVLDGERAVDELLQGRGLPTLPARPSKHAGGITISEAVERYLVDKAVRPKTASEIRTSLALFEEVVGNRPLRSLARSDFQRFLDYLSTKTVGGRSIGSVARPISVDTVGKRLGFLRAAINHALNRGWFDGRNPASGFDLSAWVAAPNKVVMPDKRGFQISELNLLFQHPWFTGCQSASQTHEPGSHRLTGAPYWAPIVALFTGCRASELGGLMLSEVELLGPHPHLKIRDNQYRPTKGGYARQVPILDALLDQGFADYVSRVRATGADRLFPDWASPRRSDGFKADDARWSNANLIRAFNRTVIQRSLGSIMLPGARREVTFHSFRGAFKAMLGLKRHAVPTNVINEVIGHSKHELDRRYVGTIPIEETYAAIRACRYEGLNLPPPP